MQSRWTGVPSSPRTHRGPGPSLSRSPPAGHGTQCVVSSGQLSPRLTAASLGSTHLPEAPRLSAGVLRVHLQSAQSLTSHTSACSCHCRQALGVGAAAHPASIFPSLSPLRVSPTRTCQASSQLRHCPLGQCPARALGGSAGPPHCSLAEDPSPPSGCLLSLPVVLPQCPHETPHN